MYTCVCTHEEWEIKGKISCTNNFEARNNKQKET